ncbi:DUF4190 domain-containing protein [Georgenia sp. 311]|nr:DUF4190 domain-containing protein [Georgenia sp. 311]
MPMVRGQLNRSWGATTSPGPTRTPSPWTVQIAMSLPFTRCLAAAQDIRSTGGSLGTSGRGILGGVSDGGWQAPGHEGGNRPEPEPYQSAPAAGQSSATPYAAPTPAYTPFPPPAPGAPLAFATSDRHRDRVLGGQGYETPAYRNDSFAATSMVLGVVGILVPGVCLLAIACGHYARHRLRRSYEGGRGLAVAGIVLGYATTAVWLAVALLYVSTRALL